MNKSIFLLIFISLAAAFGARAGVYGVKDIPNVQLADSTKLLSDPDNIIDALSAETINNLLVDIRRQTSAEVAVVVVDDFDGDDVDEFATDLFNTWGIGKKDNNNGVLVFVAKDRRRMAIRTGYGAEGVLPDIICGHIMRNIIFPQFREDEYGPGIAEGVREIHRLFTDPTAADELRSQLEDEDDAWVPGLLVTVLGVCGCAGAAMYYPTYARNRARKCPRCGKKMVKKSEEEDNAFLNQGQDLEEQIGAVDYDVWVCPDCNEVRIEKYPGKNKFEKCPHCGVQALKVHKIQTVRQPTTSTKGLERHYCKCENCKRDVVTEFALPVILAASASSIGRRGGGFGGGFGGGGFGGGGFGGGLTGGGGASGGW